MADKLTLLISSVGRRAQLVDCFRRAAHELGLQLRVIGADAAPDLSPASQLVDRCFPVPRCSDPTFVDEMLRLCELEAVRLVVPTIDPELPVFARSRQKFETAGTKVVISGPRTVEIAADKVATNRWFVEHHFPTVRQTTLSDAVSDRNLERWKFPVIVKPRQGSASVGVRIIQSPQALRDLQENGLLVEEIATGIEHTTNVFVDQSGKCLCAVPHKRLETRAGEVSKGVTTKNPMLMQLIKEVAESLPDARGPLNIQGFVSKDGSIKLTEINARFGGGFPLAFEAGANFCRWIIEDLLALPSTAAFSQWKDDLLMLRFDSAVFLPSRNPHA